MLNDWQKCKNILCIRPDNMGDLLMSGPAFRALKTSFNAKITVLTSSMAAGIARFMPEVDEVMVCDLPWVKSEITIDTNIFNETVEQLKKKNFDAAVVFTVYSQNPLPTVLLAYLAGIPNRLAYCRENPYHLLTNWVPDTEPYTIIKHQVKRDLDLVATVGACSSTDGLFINVDENARSSVLNKLRSTGFNPNEKWLIIHPGVSESKREYPIENWLAAGKKIINELGYQLIITGSNSEKKLTEYIQNAIGYGSYNAGGLFKLNEFIAMINMASVIISVNTGTIHIAAAVGTPVVVLYALTNPQHTPWKVPCKVLPFQIPEDTHSKNEVIKFANSSFYTSPVPLPNEADILSAVQELLLNKDKNKFNHEAALLPGQSPIGSWAVEAN